MIEKPSDRHADLVAAIDANGADLSRWPDRSLANRTREAVLADRGLRACLADAALLDGGIAEARAALDADIRASGAIERVTAAVQARRVPRAFRARWIAAAAAIVIAAGIGGGVVDTGIVANASQQTVDVVVLDPLVFGPLETETE